MYKSKATEMMDELANEELNEQDVKYLLKQIEEAKKDLKHTPKLVNVPKKSAERFTKREQNFIKMAFGSLILLCFALIGFSSKETTLQEKQSPVINAEVAFASEMTVDTTLIEKPQGDPSESVTLEDKLVKLSGYLTSSKIDSPIPAEIFIDTERRMNCDADFLVAITGADSSYGKNTLTNHNPGNVGNTSGGGRRHFDSWQEGVDAICAALNNQYLGGLNMIGELSGGGRKVLGLPGCNYDKCYATSMGNWNANVLSIMSELKGQQVDESYIFRRS